MSDESICSVCSRLTGFGDEDKGEPPVNLARCPSPGGLECRAVAQAVAPLRRENEVLRSNSDHLSSENAALSSQVDSMAMRIESLAEELAKPEDVRLREVLDALDGRFPIFDSIASRVSAALDEAEEFIGRAGEAERMVEAARRNLSSVAEAMTEHAYQELASALESPPLQPDVRAAEKTRVVDEWKAANGYNDLLAAYSAAVDEADRLRRLFDDAGEGQFNVLNLVESYQRNSMEADERLRAVRKLLEENGCECPCDHHPDERGPDCEVCLACRIGEAVGK
ncbi:MAG: hypothetical protein E6Q97_37595 [Desulfurellales bacterium]|nr:MAG: hypothetical protein E6Q97_37595 [Desulfurellales bacterium]